MYKKFLVLFIEAKKERNKSQIKKTLALFSDEMLKALDKEINHKIFFEFIKDDGMLFSSEKNDVINGVDVVIVTNGLLAQLLELCGIVGYEILSDRLESALNNLNLAISKNKDFKKEKEDLVDVLGFVKLASE